MAKRLD